MSNTTVALSEKTKDRLQNVKHKIEKRDRCSYSYGSTIKYLLDVEEKNGRSN